VAFRSDRGTNFVGAVDDLKIDAINVEDGPFKNHLYNSGTVWKFNSPHSSHMGGCTALVTRQVNIIAQRFELAYPPRVLRETIVHGPKASTPTLVKGGDDSTRSVGRSASPIANLNPFLDEHGILRVGSRIINSDLTLRGKKPSIVPGRHHIATLLVSNWRIHHVSCVKLLSMVRRHPLQH
jgi:hypothetical protein